MNLDYMVSGSETIMVNWQVHWVVIKGINFKICTSIFERCAKYAGNWTNWNNQFWINIELVINIG